MQGERRHSVFKMMRLGCANNGRGDGSLTEQPRERHLRKRDATLTRNLHQAVHNFAVCIFGLRVHLVPELVGLIAFGAFTLPGARQAATQTALTWARSMRGTEQQATHMPTPFLFSSTGCGLPKKTSEGRY